MHDQNPIHLQPRPAASDHRPRARARFAFGALVAGALLVATAAQAATVLDSVSPARQRVASMITLRGSGFGAFVYGTSKVVFTTPGQSIRIEARRPYVWRDDFIQVRVPSGDGANKMPKTELLLSVEGVNGASDPLGFQLVVRPAGTLSFVQRTQIVNNADVSGFLGDSNLNKARTKNAEIGDVNADGWPDLMDNNSNNSNNNTHSVLHLNQKFNAGFGANNWEPRDINDVGNFIVTIPPGGLYVGNVIVYDGDFIDLDNDELLDWVEAEAGSSLRLRVAMNGYQGVPGRFVEDSATWLPGGLNPPGSPDDLCHTDINYDGFVDVITSYRFSPNLDVLLNSNGQTFSPKIRLTATNNASIHDNFFIDANNDGYYDIIGINENAGSQLFLNNGNLPVPGFTPDQVFPDDAHSGVTADLNGDGVEDFAVTKFNKAVVYLNSAVSPGTFTRFNLPDPHEFVYDVEAADIDLDGDVDLLGASVTTNADWAARVWINDGTGQNWTTWTKASDILPGIGPYQRLSIEPVDFDLDGDLDIYLSGSDGSGPWGFGASPNQFWENKKTGVSLNLTGSCPGAADLAVSAATPGGQLLIIGSASTGSTTVGSGPCAGTVLDLVNPQVLKTVNADGIGNFNVSPNLPQSACNFYLQVVDKSDCSVSNLVAVP